MPRTPKQAAAARTNGSRSHGPTSAQGKARSAKNALKHGTYATAVLLPGESEEEYRALHARLQTELEPCGLLEEEALIRVGDIIVRMRRAAAAETDALRRAQYIEESRAIWRCIDERARKGQGRFKNNDAYATAEELDRLAEIERETLGLNLAVPYLDEGHYQGARERIAREEGRLQRQLDHALKCFFALQQRRLSLQSTTLEALPRPAAPALPLPHDNQAEEIDHDDD